MKYTSVFVIFVIIVCADSSSKTTLAHNLPKEKLLDAACQSFCKQEGLARCSQPTCVCNESDVTNLDIGKLSFGNMLETPQVNCKEDEIADFIWNDDGDSAYFLEYTKEKREREISDVTICHSHTLTNLTENAMYKIRLWSVSFSKLKVSSSNFIEIKTSKANTQPSPVTDISVKEFKPNGNSVDAFVQWKPNEELSCTYQLIWWGSSDLFDEAIISVISDPYEIILTSLDFESKVTLNIQAAGSNESIRSTGKVLNITVPPCLQVYHSLDECPPEPPENLVVEENIISHGEKIIADVTLRWSRPQLLPDYYKAQFANVLPKESNTTIIYMNVTGRNQTATFKSIELEDTYSVSLMACSSAGCSKQVVEDRHRGVIANTTYFPIVVSVIIPTIGALIAILSIVIMFVLINRYRAKKEREDKRYKYFTELEEKQISETLENLESDLIIGQDSSDKWEIDSNKIIFQNVLGEGAFGIVRRGFLEKKNGNKMEVAIKMLKDSSTAEEIRQFTQEIEIMKSVKHHPYIVSLIGCITRRRPGGPLLIVEFCSRGDLQTYLRNALDRISCMQREIISIENGCGTSSNSFTNKMYDFQNASLDDEFIIQPKHLLSIARQVALGMEHLAKTRVVHRDLAARNVLVCENHTVKVSDFGLSRDVYQDNVYCKSGGGRLPIRWMALESLTHQRYTTQSDVWSFGILLWEISTLGGTPYAGVHSCDLLDLLKSGYRLKCPSTCSADLYAIMESCWRASPKDRPTFSELSKSLENLLENVSQYLHLENVEQPLSDEMTKQNSETLNKTSTYERYVKPVNAFK